MVIIGDSSQNASSILSGEGLDKRHVQNRRSLLQQSRPDYEASVVFYIPIEQPLRLDHAPRVKSGNLTGALP
jgi:hypothetical protein